jgi:hypothetical protein
MKIKPLLIVASAACLAADVHAQAVFGSVRTTAGVPIEGVLVRATRAFPLQVVSGTTDSGGGYVVGAGLSGTYSVRATLAGYTFTPDPTNVTISGSSPRVDFTTPATAPTVITLPAVNRTATFSVLSFQVRPNGALTTVWLEYGLTASYGTVATYGNVGSGTGFSSSGVNATDLLNDTTYHFRAVASNSFGVRYGVDLTFTTLSGIPSVVTLPPILGGAAAAQLKGSANPNGASTTAWFDLGTTTNYGNLPTGQFLGNGTNVTNFSQTLVTLTPGTTYHYRAVAGSIFGTNYGADFYFTPLFTDSFASNRPVAAYGGLAWGDYDHDGRLDVVASSLSGVWRNTGNGFVVNTNAGLPYAADGSVTWGDYDNDGWLDILLTGWTWPDVTTGLARVYHNNRDGTFTDIHAGLPKIHRSSAVWGDYNNDGRLDILLAGLDVNTKPITQLWRNTGFGFLPDTNAVLPGISHGGLAWGDYDNDGRLDILLAGGTNRPASFECIAQVWRNTGSGFVNINAGLPGVEGDNNHAAVAWGDYDNDGRLDILLAGATNGTASSAIGQVWRNTGSGFALGAALTGVLDCAVAWGDCDNDGRLDIVLSGRNSSLVPTTEVWRNTGSGFFNLNAGLLGNYDGGVAWGDYDNDGRLDLLVAGLFSASDRLWRNNIPSANTPPGAPSGLAFTLANSLMTLSWSAATDGETPALGLSYNVRIGTTPGGADVWSAMASPSGFRRVAQPGNAQHGLSATLNLASMPTPYYWSVQAVDGAFAGSPFATESAFKLLPVLVPVAASNTVPSDTNGDGIVDQSELDATLANYWLNSPWLQMTNPMKLPDGFFQFALTNASAWNFSVEVTTNLVDWEFLGTAFPVYQFPDPLSTNVPQRHYRLRWP